MCGTVEQLFFLADFARSAMCGAEAQCAPTYQVAHCTEVLAPCRCVRCRTTQVFLRYNANWPRAAEIAILSADRFGESRVMARPRRERTPSASEQLERLLGYPWPFNGRPPKHDLATWSVSDDWPEQVPATKAEVEVFERWFADLFEELFGPER